ncbi:MAG: hypothetical protein QM756_29430 [Polyangiaceae bacterium]
MRLLLICGTLAERMSLILVDRARSLLKSHGELRSQALADWGGSFTLPPSLVAYYQDLGPLDITIEGYGNPFFLPSMARLWEFQAGYRWDALTNDRVHDWEDDWLVVGDHGGDPLIFSRKTSRILFAEHGAGSWDAFELFPDLLTMTCCLGAMGTVVVEAGERFSDDGYIVPRFREKAEAALADLLGSRNRADAVLATFGWG